MLDDRVALSELARQIEIQNRITVARELFKTEYLEPQEYIDELIKIDRYIDEKER